MTPASPLAAEEPSPAIGPGAPPRFAALLAALSRDGVPHAPLTRTDSSDGRTLHLLIDPARREQVERRAERSGFRRAADRPGSAVWLRGTASPGPDRLVLHEELSYGGPTPWLRASDRSTVVLGRAPEGSARLAPGDELIDAVLHGLLDLGDFPAPLRSRLAATMAWLRANPVGAGRAAERVQAELAPALTWDALLAAVVERRWDELAERRRPVARHLARSTPLWSARRRLLGLVRGSEPGPPSTEGGGPEPVATAPAEASESDDPVEVEIEARLPSERPGMDSHDSAGGGGSTERLGRRQIRGSGLLLAGRGLSTGLKFLAELLLVRYLATEAYGAWTYALSAVVFFRGFATLGLNRAIVRFLPVHLERQERGELFGVLAFVALSLMLGSGVVVGGFYAFPDVVARLAGAEPGQSLDILFVVILLVPVDTLDDFLTGVCASFTASRTIFVRRYLLSPGLRIGVAVLLVLLHADVRFLAYGYLVSGLLGIAYYGHSVYRELRDRDLIGRTALADVRLPIRRVLGYTVPVMAADWCQVVLTTIGPLMLGYFASMSAVALFRVVIPLVTLIQLVRQSFVVLFEPAASRLFARGDHEGLERFYWRAAGWVAVLTFPAFALSFTVAEPMSVLLFGDRYRAAGPILSLLALGTFAESLVGFNAPTLRVTGQLRWLIGVSAIAAVVSVGLHAALIPSMGPLGAGIASGASWAVYAMLKQVALWRGAGVRPFDLRYLAPYSVIGAATLVLAAARISWPSDTLLLTATAALCVAAVFWGARPSLSISETFPEVARLPFLGRYLG